MRSRFALGLWMTLGAVVVATFACGSEAGNATFVDETPAPADSSGDRQGAFPNAHIEDCQGLACKQVECGRGTETTVTGIVTAPNGTLPLYNAIVYVPDAPLEPLADGVTCDRCGSVSGKPLVSALTDVDGKFVLKNVPVGDGIPLVIQVGKWRRQVTLPKIEKCVDNSIVDRNLTRLPRNKSEGDIPRIAVTTGRCDQLACLLPKLGLDASEFTPNTGDGRLHLYRGAADAFATEDHRPVAAPAPAGTPDATSLYNKLETLQRYDMVMLSCECGEHQETKRGYKETLYRYASTGGRLFASHLHYAWADEGPLSTVAQWDGSVSNPENEPGPYLVDMSFPKGEAFARWLVGVGASNTLGEIPINQPRKNVGAVVPPTQRWIYRNDPSSSSMPQTTNYLSVNTPVGKPIEEQCGKFVFADMHLYGGDAQDPETALPDDNFPASCSTDLTPEEKALAFLFFELTSCVQDDTKPPVPPLILK